MLSYRLVLRSGAQPKVLSIAFMFHVMDKICRFPKTIEIDRSNLASVSRCKTTYPAFLRVMAVWLAAYFPDSWIF